MTASAANRDTQAAWEYHNATKHSWESVTRTRHRLDWTIQPRPYKLYQDALEAVPLPQGLPSSSLSALAVVTGEQALPEGELVADLKTLAAILHYSAGITRWLRTFGGRMAFRAAACTGALYHIELYVVCGVLPGLEAGVYHYGVHDEALRRLRCGDYRSALVEATGGNDAVANAPATVVCTSTYWRNAWKYQSRTYRHCFWDNGTILANTLALAGAHGLPATILTGFVDDAVNALLDIDAQQEAAISLASLGHAPSRCPGLAPPLERLGLATEPYSSRQVDYPSIHRIHAASSLARPEHVAAWGETGPTVSQPEPQSDLLPLAPLPPDTWPLDPIEAVILRRGSSRRFSQEAISSEALATILTVATRRLPGDWTGAAGGPITDLYLIVNSVEGLPSGAYVFHRQPPALELLRAGEFRSEAGYLDLGQELGADAAVNVYVLAPLGSILERFGDRGYRAAQLEGGITGGKLYLAAYALGLGATGLTFFDDDVTRFFSPHAREKSVMFLLALGQPARRGARM